MGIGLPEASLRATRAAIIGPRLSVGNLNGSCESFSGDPMLGALVAESRFAGLLSRILPQLCIDVRFCTMLSQIGT